MSCCLVNWLSLMPSIGTFPHSPHHSQWTYRSRVWYVVMDWYLTVVGRMVAHVNRRWRAGNDRQWQGRQMMCALLHEHNLLTLVAVIVRGWPLCSRRQHVYRGFLYRHPLKV